MPRPLLVECSRAVKYANLLPVSNFHFNAIEQILFTWDLKPVANHREEVDTEVRLRVFYLVSPHTDSEDSPIAVLLEYECTSTLSNTKFLFVGDFSQFDLRRSLGSMGELSFFDLRWKNTSKEKHYSRGEEKLDRKSTRLNSSHDQISYA